MAQVTLRLLQATEEGLSHAEARDRLIRHGRNVLRRVGRSPLPGRFLSQFTHLMALLLWAGGGVALVAGMRQLAIAIWGVNLVNGAFSFWQEFRAQRAVEALRQVLPGQARVVRGGREILVSAEEVVPGDVLALEEGARVPADARLLSAAGLRVDESTLTGESRPVPKGPEARGEERPEGGDPHPHAEDRVLVFGGTEVVAGRARAVVFATGMGTRLGKIAHLTQAVRAEESPLQRELVHVSRVVTVLALGVGAAFFLLALLVARVPPAQGFLFSLGMIVAFVPEGLLPTVTLALALGVQRMARRNAVVKRLSAVETLGCATVILTDKTGTLTENQMTVTGLWAGGKTLAVGGTGYSPEGSLEGEAHPSDLALLLEAGALCNDARLIQPESVAGEPRWTVVGEPMEGALLALARKGGVDPERAARKWPRVGEIPFDPIRMRMSTVHGAPGGGRWKVCVKGAPAELLVLCTAYRSGGKIVPLTPAARAEVRGALDGFARRGLRVVGVAAREGEGSPPPPEGPARLERDLVFLGLAAMEDPPRPEVAEAILQAHRAGIRIVMVTGDYGLTAESVARRIGIVRGERTRTVTGRELARMGEKELEEVLRGEPIFARVTAEDKLRLVTALQARGEVVAATGDGVNDAPALKKADIGVAMGLSGTDVAREAADMILADDNFASIVAAIEEGRAVYANIRKFITYIFTSNVPEAVPFIVFALSRGLIPPALSVMQVLAIDLGTDLMPALGLGAEPAGADQMTVPPRNRKKHLIDRSLLVRSLLWLGLLQAGLVMAVFLFALRVKGLPIAQASALALAAVVAMQVGNLFAQRTDCEAAGSRPWFANPLLWAGAASSLLVLLAIIHVPWLARLFDAEPFPLSFWLLLLPLPFLLFGWDEARKAWLRKKAACKRPLEPRPGPPVY